jgi:starvation-inducible DNA-binding protein
MSQALLHKTWIDVAAGARERLVPLLNASLADMIDLFNQTKHAHWNVKGAAFIALHELFDDVAERVEEHCDPTTSDLFTEVSRALDKDLWFLEAHLQA